MGRKRLLAVLFAGVLMGALDIAIVGPALPAIQQTFAVDSRALSWVFNVYVLFYLLGAPLLAKLSDRRGRRAVYGASLGLFAFGSLLVAAAPSFGVLLAGRAVQAFGAGGVFPVASAVIGDVLPEERRGRALGLIGAVFGIAFLLGPLIGGVLLSWGWQWLFLINLPLAAVIIWQSRRLLPSKPMTDPRPFDALGAVTLSLALAALVWALSRLDVGRLSASLVSAQVLPFLLLALIALPVFWRIERNAGDPILHPALLGSRQLRLVGLIAAVTGSTEAGMIFLPALAVAGLDVEPATASFMMLPLVLTLIVGAPAAGRVLEWTGPKAVIQVGLILTACGLVGFALPALTPVTFYAAGACVGFGLAALLGAPLRYLVMQESGEERRGAGQGLLTICLSVGQLMGAAMVGGIAAGSSGAAGYRSALLAVAVATVAALLPSAALEGRRGHRPSAPA